MLLSVSFENERPIYLQLKMQIIKGIASGQLKPGERLPSIRALSQELGINLHTVNKAYSQLRDCGYITVDRRNGAVVSLKTPKVPLSNIHERLEEAASEAICLSMSKDEFLDLCTSAYERIM